MRCYRCGGAVVMRKVRFSLETDRGLVLIDGVPAEVCVQCGEQTFSIDVVQRLEEMRDEIEAGKRILKPANDVAGAVYV